MLFNYGTVGKCNSWKYDIKWKCTVKVFGTSIVALLSSPPHHSTISSSNIYIYILLAVYSLLVLFAPYYITPIWGQQAPPPPEVQSAAGLPTPQHGTSMIVIQWQRSGYVGPSVAPPGPHRRTCYWPQGEGYVGWGVLGWHRGGMAVPRLPLTSNPQSSIQPTMRWS